MSLWAYVGLVDYNPLFIAINRSFGFTLTEPREHIPHRLIALSLTSMQYFSHRYFTTFGGSILAEGLMLWASKYALSVLNQRLNVSLLTPAASASSNLLIAFIWDINYLFDER